MEKISVIIPTIQSSIRILFKLLEVLYSDEAVDEILIINNAKPSLDRLEILSEKIKIHNSETNLYVNASWNLGANMVKNDKFLIINDDILCPKDFVTNVLKTGILDKEDTGLVGLCTKYIVQKNRETTQDIDVPNSSNSKIEIEPMEKIIETGDWASAFFARKDSYYEIPSAIKIIYGDNYLLEQNVKKGRKNYQISGVRLNHIHSLSSASGEFIKIIIEDAAFGEEYFKEYK